MPVYHFHNLESPSCYDDIWNWNLNAIGFDGEDKQPFGETNALAIFLAKLKRIKSIWRREKRKHIQLQCDAIMAEKVLPTPTDFLEQEREFISNLSDFPIVYFVS